MLNNALVFDGAQSSVDGDTVLLDGFLGSWFFQVHTTVLYYTT